MPHLGNANEDLQVLRHTCAHVLAMAVQTCFPEAKVALGPWTETGFYYDFDYSSSFAPADLTKIVAEMQRIIQADLPISQETIDREQIQAEIEQRNEPYKQMILARIPPDESITVIGLGILILMVGGISALGHIFSVQAKFTLRLLLSKPWPELIG